MNSKNTGRVGFLGLLTLLFIGLKLTGYIAWSWIWVLSPIWIPISIALLILSVVVILIVLDERAINKNIKILKDKKE